MNRGASKIATFAAFMIFPSLAQGGSIASLNIADNSGLSLQSPQRVTTGQRAYNDSHANQTSQDVLKLFSGDAVSDDSSGLLNQLPRRMSIGRGINQLATANSAPQSVLQLLSGDNSGGDLPSNSAVQPLQKLSTGLKINDKALATQDSQSVMQRLSDQVANDDRADPATQALQRLQTGLKVNDDRDANSANQTLLKLLSGGEVDDTHPSTKAQTQTLQLSTGLKVADQALQTERPDPLFPLLGDQAKEKFSRINDLITQKVIEDGSWKEMSELSGADDFRGHREDQFSSRGIHGSQSGTGSWSLANKVVPSGTVPEPSSLLMLLVASGGALSAAILQRS